MPKIINEDKLFSEAIKTLIEKGYEKATTKEIAAAADVNEATLFRKYESKANLFVTAIRSKIDFSEQENVIHSGELKSDLLAIVNAYMEINLKHGEIIPSIITEIPRHPEIQEIIDVPHNIMQTFNKILIKYQEAGILKNEPGLSLISILIGPIMANKMFAKVNPDVILGEIDPEKHVENFINGHRIK